MLVVILIIGLGIGFVAINVGEGSHELRLSAKQLANNTSLVAAEAVLSGEQWGLEFYRSTELQQADAEVYGYRWLKRIYWTPPEESGDKAKWLWRPTELLGVEIENDFSALIKLQLEKEDIEIFIDDLVAFDERNIGKNTLKPDIYLFSNGEMTPFTLKLLDPESDDIRQTITGDLLGRIKLNDNDGSSDFQ